MAAQKIPENLLQQPFYYNQPVDSWPQIPLQNHMEIAESTFIEFTDIIDNTNIEYFLAFGTLLGYYRNNGLIPHDLDIDFGFDSKDVPILVSIINTALLEADFQFIRRDRGIFTFIKNDVAIDMYEYSKQKIADTEFYAHPAKERGYNMLASEVEPLKQIEFLNKTMNIPGHTEAFLKRRYGDWQTPA